MGAKTVGGKLDLPAQGERDLAGDNSPPIISQELQRIRGELSEVKVALTSLLSDGSEPLSISDRLTAIEGAVARASAGSTQVEDARTRQTAAEDLLGQVRHHLATTAEKLAQTETRLYQQNSEAVWLRAASLRADELTSEVNALRYRCERAETDIARLRNSASWYVTRPLRWIGNQYGKLRRAKR